MQEDFVIDFVAEIADKDVKVIRGVFLAVGVGLIGPVDSDLLLVDSSAIEGVQSTFSSAWVIILDEAIVEAFGVVVLVWNDFDTADMPSGVKDLLEYIFCDSWIQATDVQRSLVWFRCGSSALLPHLGTGHCQGRLQSEEDCCFAGLPSGGRVGGGGIELVWL